MWNLAFWKDAGERVFATFLAALIGILGANEFNFSDLGEWNFWKPVLAITVLTLIKTLAAGLTSPNTGASLGTTVPTGNTEAIVDAKTQQTVTPEGKPVDVVPVVVP